jgi:MoaA/NifB/PqqE/SkfB family radical SAM enzyme
MVSIGAGGRERFRAFALDGALLFFQPSSGATIRIQNDRTKALTRRAPRVVMFGVTNRCNLSCDFCSRDTARPSTWTAESAARVLSGLAEAGTLEVAFGGGEPFAFPGFAKLVAELHETTPLALNVTTNGTLLDDRTFAPFRGRLGQVRLSIYDDSRWLKAARAFGAAGQLWGANVLVDDRRLEEVPALIDRLQKLGCHDVSLLGYVGGDPSLQLTPSGRTRLKELIGRSGLSCRISVCFGDRLGAPRLFDGADGSGDCGAGYDFVTLTTDGQLQSCSFQDGGTPADSAGRVLALWRERRTELGHASRRLGCARASSASVHGAHEMPPLAVWHAFSGNNSGECILVGKFESSEAAQRFVSELQPGWAPNGDYSEEWQALFRRENVALAAERAGGELLGRSPSALLPIGRTVLAVSYDSDDAFPELRALAWKRSGFVVPDGIHLHHSPALLAAVRCRTGGDASDLAAQNPALRLFPHGDVLFVLVPEATRGEGGSLESRVQDLISLAAGRQLGAELVLDEWDESAFLAAKQRLGTKPPLTPRLLAVFQGAEATARAERFAAGLREATAHSCAGAVLVEGLERRKRIAVLAMRQGATVAALDGAPVDVRGWFWNLPPPRQKGTKADPWVLDVEALRRELSVAVGRPVHVEQSASYLMGASAHVVTEEPHRVLSAMAAVARNLGSQLNPWISEVEPMTYLLRRLLADVS